MARFTRETVRCDRCKKEAGPHDEAWLTLANTREGSYVLSLGHGDRADRADLCQSCARKVELLLRGAELEAPAL
jgi:hypothetical protein